MENIKELKIFLAIPKDIVITTHRNPDGDAIGSSLGLAHYLVKHGHTVKIIVPSEYPEFLEWMPGVADIIVFDHDPELSKEMVERADLIFCLDFNGLDRIDKLGDLIAPLKTLKVMIDHHLYPDDFADYLLSDTTASSTSELVFDFIEMLGDRRLIDRKIGDCLYTGILADTASFKYSTSPKLFRITAQLLEAGVEDDLLQDLVFNNLIEKNLRLLGHCLHNRMEILPDFKTGIITLTKEDYADFDIKRGDTEGIVNYLLMLRNVTLAAFIMEQPTIVKISLRSKGDFSVQDICRKHFRGGGHKNASGGASFQNLEGTVRRFKRILNDYIEELNPDFPGRMSAATD